MDVSANDADIDVICAAPIFFDRVLYINNI
jgi:hypothetical protein